MGMFEISFKKRVLSVIFTIFYLPDHWIGLYLEQMRSHKWKGKSTKANHLEVTFLFKCKECKEALHEEHLTPLLPSLLELRNQQFQFFEDLEIGKIWHTISLIDE
ncbi:hypothetical protein TorRG33x02_001930 [Trema orientale]|uniref:Uncharacterized protein n=1 Tax=Trema orientale TaxID=63057 RepID=A0A2P5G1J3_TREOI|nr:hypothetical protein TorRG33x02_001930 [Trema orientale]